jgi:mannose-6-phosphate isomerase-like protein (cupin superfamily)
VTTAALIHVVVSGLATGSIYALMALSLVIIYNATRTLNFAQGEMLMVSTFVAWSSQSRRTSAPRPTRPDDAMEATMSMPALDLFSTFVQLGAGGTAAPVPWTPDFWRRLSVAEGDRVVGAKHGREPGDFHPAEWEMHPHGEELLLVLSGALDVILDSPDGERTIALTAGGACLVPRGVWHRLTMHQPSDLLFVTPPSGTRLRPLGAR